MTTKPPLPLCNGGFWEKKMSRVCGIVAEYNPFHNGHKHHISMAREVSGADDVVVVMSGNFVQRGEPAIVDKFVRTRMALLGGADMVLELPVGFSTASAETFSSGAVYILGKTGMVTDLCFGAETPNLQDLQVIVRHLVNESESFKTTLKANLNQGVSFPKARAAALKEILPQSESVINSPNNILSIEYLKALEKFGFDIKPHPVGRKGVNHHDTAPAGKFASATALRKEILVGKLQNISDFIPQSSIDLLDGEPFNQIDNFSAVFHYNVQGNPLEKHAENHYKISDVITAAKTKNITHTALKRLVLNVVLGIKSPQTPQYIRVLGFRRDKSFLVSELQRKATLPVITNLKNAPLNLIADELQATHLYWLALRPQGTHPRNELSAQMIII
ncbi:MAG: nucleotidyltransferase family protein [Defluviitaleaceae bacterium]|nr:nucleotidyltransferase family protein [Defluviitaleaceae bacterium]